MEFLPGTLFVSCFSSFLRWDISGIFKTSSIKKVSLIEDVWLWKLFQKMIYNEIKNVVIYINSISCSFVIFSQ